MSTVCAAKKDGIISMCCETQSSFGSLKIDHNLCSNNDKIFKWGNNLVGITGFVATSMILKDIIRKEKKPPTFSNEKNIYEYFKKLHVKLKEEYFINPKEDDDYPTESSQLDLVIANKNGIFGVHSLREVYLWKKFWAHGSGRRYALGAMNAIYDLPDFDAQKIAKEGVRAGITFDDSSGGKIISKKVSLD